MSIDPRPCIGLVVPPAAGLVPDDAHHLYGDRVRFIARGLGIGGVSPQGFAPVIERIVECARELSAAGASAISMMGTSISFYRGAERTETLRLQMEQATGVPCTTMSHAVVRALQALGARRVAVGTSYIDELNQRLVDYLHTGGLSVTAIEGLAITAVRDVGEVSASTLIALAQRVAARDPGADAVLISCGGLLTRDVIETVEARLGLPVVASSPAGFWDVMRTAGLDPRAPGFGQLLRLGR